MPDFNHFSIDSITYNIRDDVARQHINNDTLHVTKDEKNLWNNNLISNSKIELIDLSTSTDIKFSIQPNKVYLFGKLSTPIFTFQIPDSNSCVNVYTFQFTADAKCIPTFNCSNNMKLSFKGVSSFVENSIYEVSMLNYLVNIQ